MPVKLSDLKRAGGRVAPRAALLSGVPLPASADIGAWVTAERRPAAKQGKYGNEKCTLNGAQFDSKAERKRWAELRLLAKAGYVSNVRRQVPFELIPQQRLANGRVLRSCVYVADFLYRDEREGREVVEDVKGAVTPEFRIKRKLMLFVHGIEIRETKA